MKNRIIIILLIIVVSRLSFAQVLYPVEMKGAYNQLFDKTGAYTDYENKSGYINITGKQIVPYKYDEAEAFSDGLGKVRNNGKYGFVDNQGKEVVPCIYEQATSFENGFSWVVKNGISYLMDKNQRLFEIDNVLEEKRQKDFPSDELIRIRVNEKIGYANLDNELIILAKYDEAFPFVTGLAVVKIGGVYMVVNKNGKEQPLPFKVCHSEFVNGKLAVQNAQEKWGLIDENLNLVTPCTFDNKYACLGVKNYVSEYKASKNEKGNVDYLYNLEDENGKELLERKYLGRLEVSDDRIVCLDQDNSFVIFDLNLKMIKSIPNASDVSSNYKYHNGACLIHTGDTYGTVSKYLDKNGKVFWTSKPWYVCFPASAMVSMADFSNKPIQNIAVGDEVLSYDEQTKTYVSTNVLEVGMHEGNFKQVIITFQTSEIQYASLDSHFSIESNQLIATPNHPVLTNKGIVCIGKLQEGDVLFVWNDIMRKFDERKVTSSCYDDSVEVVFSLKTDRNNYLVEDVVVMVK